jgi:hypothetical protein
LAFIQDSAKTEIYSELNYPNTERQSVHTAQETDPPNREAYGVMNLKFVDSTQKEPTSTIR